MVSGFRIQDRHMRLLFDTILYVLKFPRGEQEATRAEFCRNTLENVQFLMDAFGVCYYDSEIEPIVKKHVAFLEKMGVLSFKVVLLGRPRKVLMGELQPVKQKRPRAKTKATRRPAKQKAQETKHAPDNGRTNCKT
jgi:hypothetical protein